MPMKNEGMITVTDVNKILSINEKCKTEGRMNEYSRVNNNNKIITRRIIFFRFPGFARIFGVIILPVPELISITDIVTVAE